VTDSDVVFVADGDSVLRESSVKEEKVFQIASVTKTFAATALVKMTNDPRYHAFFNPEDPLATPLSDFEDSVDKNGSDNQKRYFAELKSSHPRYSELTLRHLLNHSSGISQADFLDEFRQDQTKLYHLSDRYSSPVITSEDFGKFQYSDANYNNLLAPVMEAVASEVVDKKVAFSEIVKELVLVPLGLSKTFMADEMTYDVESSEVRVRGRPEVKVAPGSDYFAETKKLTPAQDFNYDSAAGGMYSTAHEVAMFYRAILREEGLFNKRESEIFFDPKNFIESDLHSYGAGIRKVEAEENQWFHHGGAGIGSYAHVIAQKNKSGEVKASCAAISYENLTRPIAAALLGDEKKKGDSFIVDEVLLAKMNELAAHSNKDLIAMRQELDLLEMSFAEKSAQFQKIYAEKYLPGTSMSPTGSAVRLASGAGKEH
jgi:CubicO group peptidase (beta-lactamase class C family)